MFFNKCGILSALFITGRCFEGSRDICVHFTSKDHLMMASAQVVETTVNTNNSPSQDYTTNPDDHSNHNIVSLYADVVEINVY